MGLRNPGIGELGPGYDDSAVYGRKPLVANREGGKFYERNWLAFLRRPSNFVMVETWSEFHEGTDICESKEYGRQYIELTRKYADLFKRGWHPPWPKGNYTGARTVSAVLGRQNQEAGLRLVECEDGRTEPVAVAGSEARVCKPAPGKFCYCYFSADDSFKWAGAMDATVEVEYFDAAPGALLLEFDGSDLASPFQGAYSRCAETVELKGNQTWRTTRFKLRGARLLHGQNGGADFRLVVQSPNLPVRKVVLRRG